MDRKIDRIVKMRSLDDHSTARDDLAYRLSKTPDERIAAVELLRRQHPGTTEQFRRVARVIRREPR